MVIRAIQHPSQVIELQMRKAGRFKFKAGQYLFLNCPYIADHEWHPFTISSGTSEDFVSVHIRVVGDWTGKLQRLMNPDDALGLVCSNLSFAPDGSPIFRIDGPFGAASEEIFRFETVMLIGAGIGVTPFASILKTIHASIEGSTDAEMATGTDYSGEERILHSMPVRKVYFYWIVRERNAFEWFFEILCLLEANNIHNFLEIHAYLTTVKNEAEAQRLLDESKEFHAGERQSMMLLMSEGRDPITGLCSGTHYGRPNFEDIFQTRALLHPEEDVGVFFCGPPVLSKLLYQCSRKYTKETTTRFHYHKENF